MTWKQSRERNGSYRDGPHVNEYTGHGMKLAIQWFSGVFDVRFRLKAFYLKISNVTIHQSATTLKLLMSEVNSIHYLNIMATVNM